MDKKLSERFWSKVNFDGPIPEHRPDLGKCWEWAAGRRRGYGQFLIGGRKVNAHRVAYERAFGAIPDGMYVLHRCDNRCCVRRDHLFLGTHADNMRDAARKGTFSTPEKLAALERFRPVMLGERNPISKLTVASVRELRIAHANGTSTTELGIRFGVDPRTVRHVVQRKLWRHVD